VQGWFGTRPSQDKSGIAECTAQDFASTHKESIALLHLDADLYSSTKTVLDAFAKHIVPGTVILFNEYWNHPTWKKHEFRAWQEHVAQYNVRYEYIAYASDHQEVAVRVL
jgi:arabinogalactan endo-1,4-beta-galactosidase